MSQELKDELEESINDCSRFAKRSYFWAQVLFLITILASFFASILAAGDLGKNLLGEECQKAVTALLAALPGTALLINNSFRFEERTKWFWKKVRVCEKLLRELRDSNNTDLEAVSSTYSEKMEELELEWPAMDSPAQQPKKK
ncbi:hypothetical protein [Cerasicoccus arenae]|uniref:Uncharacterized protein n=1 Tax=Cerasicoccus arenae TaxID=424488 RepID=A0A8J3GFQ5_9BACT|nr:hypothetical protein [Cerasicoccus arenae]MBK1859453.1 hypothetical protein [Cerasicoccus arenae]GHC13648.1 hypothetical protein GCM10007047_33720 [Cerasicoccus arenae]